MRYQINDYQLVIIEKKFHFSFDVWQNQGDEWKVLGQMQITARPGWCSKRGNCMRKGLKSARGCAHAVPHRH